jgi:hypothetical protein
MLRTIQRGLSCKLRLSKEYSAKYQRFIKVPPISFTKIVIVCYHHYEARDCNQLAKAWHIPLPPLPMGPFFSSIQLCLLTHTLFYLTRIESAFSFPVSTLSQLLISQVFDPYLPSGVWPTYLPLHIVFPNRLNSVNTILDIYFTQIAIFPAHRYGSESFSVLRWLQL